MKGFVSPKDKKQPLIINPNSYGVGVLTRVADPDSVNLDPDPDSVNPDPEIRIRSGSRIQLLIKIAIYLSLGP
jgi:hypothetical protein